MPCLPLPTLPLPTVPAPFSLLPALPPLPKLQAGVCCQAINLGSFVPPIPLPPFALSVAVPLMASAMQVVSNYMRNLPIACPRE